MKHKSILFLITGFLLGSIPLLAVSFAEDEQLIPGWIKNTAKFWVEGGVSDKEFLNALQFLVKEGMLVIPESETKQTVNEKEEELSFESEIIKCTQNDYGYVDFQFSITNNLDKDYTFSLALLLVDEDGKVLEIVEHYTDVRAGSTSYEERSLNDHPDFWGCSLQAEDVYEN